MYTCLCYLLTKKLFVMFAVHFSILVLKTFVSLLFVMKHSLLEASVVNEADLFKRQLSRRSTVLLFFHIQ